MTSDIRVHSAIPPYILHYLLKDEDAEVRQAALNTLLTTARLRGERSLLAAFPGATTPGNGRRTVFDCRNGTNLSYAVLARSEDGQPATDPAANRAFDILGKTRDFYQQVFGRNSIDGKGMRLDGYIHYDEKYNNAFWDGREMCFGDGDGVIFSDLTGSTSVVAHELAHGVTEHTAGLAYHDQPGALNESLSDVFGALVEQWSLKQSADQADWLIGREVFTPRVKGDALRSLKAPGHAWAHDPQPDHMSKYVHTSEDNGGVHFNSGIPNKAFYLVASTIGGNAWEAPGTIWYESLKACNSETRFQEFADLTHRKAGDLYGADSTQQRAVLGAWQQVGISVTGVPAGVAKEQGQMVGVGQEASVADLARQVQMLMGRVESLSQDVSMLKGQVGSGRTGGR
jgi:Zn-dependent metalloprotease